MWKKCKMWYRTAEVIISPGETEQRERCSSKFWISGNKGKLCTWSTLTSLFWTLFWVAWYETTQNKVSKPTLIYLYCPVIFCCFIPTWINGATNDSPQRIPCPVIKPVVKLIKPFFSQEAGRTVVEVPENEMKVRHYFTGEIYLQCLEVTRTEVALTDQTHGWRFQISRQKKVWWRMLKRRRSTQWINALQLF